MIALDFGGTAPNTVDPRSWEEVLLDSEASLRLVARALIDLRLAVGEPAEHAGTDLSATAGKLVQSAEAVLTGAHREILGIARSLGRTADVLRSRLGRDSEWDRGSAGGTEAASRLATAAILDGLDLALHAVERLEGMATNPDQADRAYRLRTNVRRRALEKHTEDAAPSGVDRNDPVEIILGAERRLAHLAHLFLGNEYGFAPASPATVD
jgi:hypothetical protein